MEENKKLKDYFRNPTCLCQHISKNRFGKHPSGNPQVTLFNLQKMQWSTKGLENLQNIMLVRYCNKGVYEEMKKET
jgi:hypothetical protein